MPLHPQQALHVLTLLRYSFDFKSFSVEVSDMDFSYSLSILVHICKTISQARLHL